MAQHDYNIANQTFPNTRSDLNDALLAVASNNSGTAAPSTTHANQWFYETDTNKLQIRNEDNDAYITIAELDQSNDTIETITSDTLGVGGARSLGLLHIQSGDSSADVEASKDELVIEGSANSGMTILSGASSQGGIAFGDSGDNDIGRFTYSHSDNSLRTHTNGSEAMRISSSQQVGIGTTSPSQILHVESSGTTNAIVKSTGSSSAASVGAINNSGTEGKILMYGSGQGAFGSLGSGEMAVYSNSAGMSIMNNNASGVIKFSLENGSEKMRINNSGDLATGGETAPDVSPGGLTINTGANDGHFLTFKNSDVAHGMTDMGETDTVVFFKKGSATTGGLELDMMAEDVIAAQFQGFAGAISTARSTDANATIINRARLKSGTAWGNLGSNGNLFAIANHNSTRFIFDSEGDFHADSSINASSFDTYEDAQLVRAFDLSHGQGVINSTFDKYVKYNHESLAEAGLVGREKDGTPNHFINITGLQRLHNGAIWQQYEKHQRLASAFYKLAEKTIGKEEADKLLTEEEIKLLN